MQFQNYPYAIFEKKIIPLEEAKISIMTNALHYGVGIFGGIKVFDTPDGPGIFRLDDHVSRLQKSVEFLNFRYKFNAAQVKKDILKLAKKNKIQAQTYIRPIIYRSDTRISPAIEGDYDLAVYMLAMPGAYYNYEEEGIRVNVSSWQRNSSLAIPPKTKATGGYINSALAIDEAKKLGFDSAIMLDKDDYVSEGAVMNLFIVKEGCLITPPADSDILEGITRKTIFEIAAEAKIPFKEAKVSKEELYSADEVFFCGTATDITWCSQIDDKNISKARGPLTAKIESAFSKLPVQHKELFTVVN
ncbi:MAG TPA: branched-chain amino acid transaminase [Candidatus Saccharimonadales bacterium]|nr:branched-chain amino acid transaminase [Candidatus Saccharimonadales bacterium]